MELGEWFLIMHEADRGCTEKEVRSVGRPDNRRSSKKHNTYHLYIYSIPPDDGLQIFPKHVEFDEIN